MVTSKFLLSSFQTLEPTSKYLSSTQPICSELHGTHRNLQEKSFISVKVSWADLSPVLVVSAQGIKKPIWTQEFSFGRSFCHLSLLHFLFLCYWKQRTFALGLICLISPWCIPRVVWIHQYISCLLFFSQVQKKADELPLYLAVFDFSSERVIL